MESNGPPLVVELTDEGICLVTARRLLRSVFPDLRCRGNGGKRWRNGGRNGRLMAGKQKEAARHWRRANKSIEMDAPTTQTAIEIVPIQICSFSKAGILGCYWNISGCIDYVIASLLCIFSGVFMNRSVGLVQFCYKWVNESEIVSLSCSILISPGVRPLGDCGSCGSREQGPVSLQYAAEEDRDRPNCPFYKKYRHFHPKTDHPVLEAFQRR